MITVNEFFSDEELNEYHEIFSFFDRHHTGEIDLNELGLIVRSIGFHPSENRIKQFQKDYGDNQIDFQQFLQILICLTNEIEDEIDIIEAFRVFDKEGQGMHVPITRNFVYTSIELRFYY
jgi:calmodulin